MVINSPCLTDKKELAIPRQTATGKELSNPLMAGKSKEVGTLRYLGLVVPLTKVGDEVVHKELGDRMERAATTASSFNTEQDSGGYTPGSDEGSKKLNELTELCTKLFDRVTSLEKDLKQTKKVHVKALTKLGRMLKSGFEDMLKAFDREDLDTLWSLVKEKFRSAEPTEDMEQALWVELKRLYEPDKEDAL
ncbi:hypothetical protein Tco_1044396 [Tanacetum coccineum]|uniref:Uncharacterized protein n=1 Tax=Tanacetum coccineum TaxID=301880 RepID=A0ABQ5GPS9_9ASTR